MTLKQIIDILEADILTENLDFGREIKMIYASDLMSDVLAFVKLNTLLLTGLTNVQVVRTAEMAEISAVCFVNGKKPQKETVRLALENKIPLLTTKLSMYESCGRLYTKD